jgi:hypothetical protein
MERMILRTAAVLLLASAATLAATRQGIFLDRSGSMKPYYQDGLIVDLGQSLVKTIQDDGQPTLFAFGTTVVPITQISNIEALPFGESTYLDRVLDRAVSDKLQIVWMVTDNVEDTPGAPEAGNTEVFYRRLRGEAVQRVTIFPVRQAPGRGGIVVYALVMDESGREAYDREISNFGSRIGQALHTEPLRMKPLDRDTVDISFLRAGGPNGGTKTYSTGQPVQERIEIRFKSRFDHLEIAGGSIKVVENSAKFDSQSLLVPERRAITITPTIVQRLGAGDETEQVYIVDVDLGKIALKKDVASLWKAAFGKSSEEALLNLQFLIEVPQKNFHLRKQFLQQYHAGSLAEAKATGKVYAVDQLPSLMSDLVTEIRVSSPVVFRVEYPWWPASIWILLAAVIISVLVLLVRAVPRMMPSRSRLWTVRAETEAKTPLDCSLEKATITVQRDVIGSIVNNAFQPAAGVSLDNRATSAAISHGLRMKVATPRRAFYLIFEDSKTAVSAATAAAPQLRRR